jgi:hypothetical protein
MLPKLKRGIFMGKLTMELYLNNLSKRYKTATKHEKGVLLDELCAASGFHKKHAIRLLNARKKKQQRPINQGRPAVYPAELYLEPLKRIWLLSDQLGLGLKTINFAAIERLFLMVIFKIIQYNQQDKVVILGDKIGFLLKDKKNYQYNFFINYQYVKKIELDLTLVLKRENFLFYMDP